MFNVVVVFMLMKLIRVGRNLRFGNLRNLSSLMCFEGDPCNIALLAHWDGFQATRHTTRSCRIVEVQILNCRKYGALKILPVLFILLLTDVILTRIKETKTLFLEHLVDELEISF